MFTGIIESIGLIKAIQKQGENFHYTVTSDISKELKLIKASHIMGFA